MNRKTVKNVAIIKVIFDFLIFTIIFWPYGLLKAIGYGVMLAGFIGGFDTGIWELTDQEPIEFKSEVERRGKGKNEQVKIVFYFKNHTKKPIIIGGYRIEWFFNDEMLVQSAMNEGYHPYGRVINPTKKEWQKEPFFWIDSPRYGIVKPGTYACTTKIRFDYEGQQKILSNDVVFSQETDLSIYHSSFKNNIQDVPSILDSLTQEELNGIEIKEEYI